MWPSSTFSGAVRLLAVLGLALPTLAEADSTLEYVINGSTFELALSEPVSYDEGETYEAEFNVLRSGVDGEFEVTGAAVSNDPDGLFLSWPVATAVLGEALEVPLDGYFEFIVNGIFLEVDIAKATTFPASTEVISTLLGGITPITIIDGVYPDKPPPVFEQIMSAVTGVPVAGTGNLLIGFEEVVENSIRKWRITVNDLEGSAVGGAHVTHVIPNPDPASTQDFLITNVTNGDGITEFGAPTLDPGTQIYFVATNAVNDVSEGGSLVVVPPSAAP